MRFSIILAALSFAAILCAESQNLPEIVIERSIPISTDDPTTRHVESWLAVNPKDPQNLIAASMTLGNPLGIGVYASMDGGMSWMRAVRESQSIFNNIDPAIAFDAEGNAYFINGDVAVWKSTDGGRHWGPGVKVPGRSYDRPLIDVDRSTGPLHGRIYVSAKMPITVFGHPVSDVMAVTSSEDAGLSFSYPRLFLPAPEKELLNVPTALVVTSEGQLVMVLQTFGPENIGLLLMKGQYSILISKDGGQSFSGPIQAANFHVYGHKAEGKSLLAAGGGRIAIDHSNGPRHGWMYLTWLDAVDGYYQVMTNASSDGGKTWSSPVRVNDNQTSTDESNPAIAVNDEGTVGIVWNDRRNDPTDRCYQAFFSASIDGGKTFTKNQSISQDFTCPIGRPSKSGEPLSPDPDVDPVRSEYRFKNGGDTQGIVGLPNGSFHLAWINGGSGEMQLWSTVVSVRILSRQGSTFSGALPVSK